jgi:hypothetical protein
MCLKKLLSFFAIALTVLLNCTCGKILNGLSSPTSEIVHYQGIIAVEGDATVSTTTAIYAANLDYKVKAPGDQPLHPASNGSFQLEVTTSSHSAGVTVEHWQCGPLRILIEGDNIVRYYDSLTNEKLKALEQNSAGEWVLPTIILQKK